MANTLDMEVAVLLNGKTAIILDDTARAELWPKLVAEAPQVGEFQTRSTRQVPVFMLTRQDCPVTRAAGLHAGQSAQIVSVVVRDE
jgi:hypothetical protein